MTSTDRWGAQVSAPDAFVSARFDDATLALCLMRGSPSALLDEAIEHDRSAVLPQVFRTYLDLYAQTSEGNRSAGARLDATSDAPVDDRSRAHLAAASAWHGGDLSAALAALERWILEQPRDLLALRVAQDLAFFLGDQRALLELPDGALGSWSEADPERGLVVGMQAFGLEESGRYREAEEAAHLALALDRTDAWATHALAHVFEMEGRSEEGAAFLRTTSSDWSPSFFASHNWWHLALFLIELDDLEGATSLLVGPIDAPGSEVWFEIVNQASLRWRLWLIGAEPPPVPPSMLDVLGARVEERLSTFNDLHAMVALSLAGEAETAGRLIDVHRAPGGSAADADLLEGIAAFSSAEWSRAASLLAPASDASAHLGGSNAQRDLIDQTRLLAEVRGGGAAAVIDALVQRHPTRWSPTTTARLLSSTR